MLVFSFCMMLSKVCVCFNLILHRTRGGDSLFFDKNYLREIRCLKSVVENLAPTDGKK